MHATVMTLRRRLLVALEGPHFVAITQVFTYREF